MRILVAEDETITGLDLRNLLEESATMRAEARDGQEAVELAREHEPDLAILDVKMPRLDGIEAARTILEERPILIVMLTAYGQDEFVSCRRGRGVRLPSSSRSARPTCRRRSPLPERATRSWWSCAMRRRSARRAPLHASRSSGERIKLMAHEGLSEDDASLGLRKASQLSGKP